MSKHSIVHIELSSRDHEETGKFYHDLFGWEVTQIPDMHYATFTTGDGSPGGGFNPVSEDYPAGTIMFYVETDAIQETLDRAVALGGKALVQPTPIPTVGQFAVFTDLTGNKVALLQPEMP